MGDDGASDESNIKRWAAPATIFLLLVTTFLHAQSRQKTGLVLEGAVRSAWRTLACCNGLLGLTKGSSGLVAGTSMGGLVGYVCDWPLS